MRCLAFLLLPATLAACAEFPDVDRAIGHDAVRGPYPDLIPVEEFLAERPARLDENSAGALEYRINRLNRRAEALRNLPTD